MTLDRARNVSSVLLVGAVALAACTSADDPSSDASSATPALAGTVSTERAVVPPPGDASVTTSTVAALPRITEDDPDVPTETSDPNVISRRTDGLDVLMLPEGVELPPGYTQAAVPVDAYAAAEMTVSTPTGPAVDPPKIPAEAFDAPQPAVVDQSVEVSASIRSCRLVAVWVLPHPNEIVVGYEDYPELTCAVPLEHTVTFHIPVAGINSEGAWNYTRVPPVVPLRKVGATD